MPTHVTHSDEFVFAQAQSVWRASSLSPAALQNCRYVVTASITKLGGEDGDGQMCQFLTHLLPKKQYINASKIAQNI